MHYLCSYRPIITTREGYTAVKEYDLPPFIDGTCRREPDFEAVFPAISALCRTDKFAPRLHPGDTVSYITCKGHHLLGYAHWRLVAILQIRERFESHEEAANWYISQGVALPSNCLVAQNPPNPFTQTHQLVRGYLKERKGVATPEQMTRLWDASYRDRAKRYSTFLACDTLFRELHQPPVLTDTMFRDIFGRIPGTQNPPRITDEQAAKLRALAWSTEASSSYSNAG